MNERVIFHMDGDAFFVGVEVAKNPKLRGLPVVTGEERGIVSALSYEAKALGIKRGMPIFKLRKEFPKVIVLAGDYASYAKYSSQMFDIVRRYTDLVEEYSIDECFADLTGWSKHFKISYKQIAEKIKDEIRKEIDLSVSIGLAPTKCLSKLASKWKKPNGLTEITERNSMSFLDDTPIEKIWGIGFRTAVVFQRFGVNTAGDFVRKDLSWVKEHFSKPYQVIWHELRGENIMEVDSSLKTSYSSIQKTRTFHPKTNNPPFLLSQLSKNIEEACRKARHYNLIPNRVSFFLKTQEFRYHSFELELAVPTSSPEIIVSLSRKYFGKMWRREVLYRTTGVGLHGLVPEFTKQMDLFGGTEKANKFEEVHKQIDSLEQKLGKRMIYLASTHNARNIKVKGTDADDLERDLLFL